MIPTSQRALLYHERGDPLEVLLLDEIPVPEPVEGQVLLEMLASAVHPSDVGLINGSYGRLKDLPAVAGREGVGKVVAVGPGAEEKSRRSGTARTARPTCLSVPVSDSP